ncbi:hypothetical protein L1887_14482 [Cichorium endivia]|nr:hypothetical protein L1887_14482 [Cichorium endivia]
MDSMDVKGIAWVGNIYQKFEAMCLEVEEAMCQDLLPPSSKDLSKVASAELLLNPYLEFGIHMKPISTFKEDPKDPVHVKGISKGKKGISCISEDKKGISGISKDKKGISGISKDKKGISGISKDKKGISGIFVDKKDISGISEDKKGISGISEDTKGISGISEDKLKCSNDGWEDWSAASFNWEMSDKDESNEVIECESTRSRGGQEGQICNLDIDTKGGKSSRCISSSNIIRAECTAPCENSGILVSEMVSQDHSNTSSGDSIDGDLSLSDACENSSHVSSSQTASHVSGDIECGQSIGDEVFLSHTGSVPDSNPDLEEKNKNTTILQTTEPIKDESGFEETCVLVDGNDYHPINNKQETKHSYKKKIQGAFSLKKKSTRKQEYKQLAKQHDNLTFPEKLSTRDSIESEWELL